MKQLQERDNRAKRSCRHKEEGSPEEMESGYKQKRKWVSKK
jgi:hypothetical protein